MARLGIESGGLRKEEAGMLCHQAEHSSPNVARFRFAEPQRICLGSDDDHYCFTRSRRDGLLLPDQNLSQLRDDKQIIKE